MATLIKQLDEPIKGKLSKIENWWRLMRDDESGDLFVEHEWSYPKLRTLNTNSGTHRFSTQGFLESNDRATALAREVLKQALAEMNHAAGLDLAFLWVYPSFGPVGMLHLVDEANFVGVGSDMRRPGQ